MNNTAKRNLTAIAAILMAATLVAGTAGTFVSTKSALAANNNSGNTVTGLGAQNRGFSSGFDTTTDQEAQNTICTHPGENAACTQEGAVAVAAPQPTKKTCEQCFTTKLSADQISGVLDSIKRRLGVDSLAEFCLALQQNMFPETVFRAILNDAKVDLTTQNEIIACLKDIGIVLRNT
jgi:hypothetical protein